MFTGIIENLAEVVQISQQGTNKTFTLKSSISQELKIDQSVSHNGVCLTVESLSDNTYQVTAIDETLKKSNLGNWKVGDEVNLERSLSLNKLLDGHVVQGHVDEVGKLVDIKDEEGSFVLKIQVENPNQYPVINKGSITLNGISLTVVETWDNAFSVAIIPYTWEHTNLKNLKVGDNINIEYDVLGKYVQKITKMGTQSR